MVEKVGISVVAEDQFSEILARFDRLIAQCEQSTGKATKTVTKMGKQQESSFKKMAGSFKNAALQAVGFGAGMFTVEAAVNKVRDVIAGTIGTATRMQAAMAGLGVSAQAANREFGASVGTADHWRSAVKRLSDEMIIFSDISVAQATARTIDMTKRLGLNAAQMEEVIRRSGDLAAKTGVDLVSAVERVTSALRGEAESAEYLGLTLSETYMATHAAELGFTKAWRSMTEVEKSAVRLAAFMQQTEGVLGTAADSVDTLAGAQMRLAKQQERLGALIGEKLIPIQAAMTTSLADLIEEIEREGVTWERNIPVYARAYALREGIIEQTKKLTPEVEKLATQYQNAWGPVMDMALGTNEFKRALEDLQPPVAATAEELRDYGLELTRAQRVSQDIVDTKNERIAAEEAEKIATEANERAMAAYEKAIESVNSKIDSMIESLLSPTPVTQLDQWKTQVGTYEDKWDEAARRMRSVMEDPAKSPWTKLMIPPDVQQKGITDIKIYAAEWVEGFYAGMRPEAIDWDAFMQSLRDQMAMAASRENMLAKAMELAAADPVLQDISKGMVESSLNAMLGIAPPPVFGTMGEQMQNLTTLQIPGLDTALTNLNTVSVPGLALATETLYTDAESQFTALTTVVLPAYDAAIVAVTETARVKFALITGWIKDMRFEMDELVKATKELKKTIDALRSKTITITIRYEYEGVPPAQRGGVVAPHLPRGTPVPVLAHAGEGFMGYPRNPAWASRTIPGPGTVAGSTTISRSTTYNFNQQFGPNTVSGGVDMAAFAAYIRQVIVDEFR